MPSIPSELMFFIGLFALALGIWFNQRARRLLEESEATNKEALSLLSKLEKLKADTVTMRDAQRAEEAFSPATKDQLAAVMLLHGTPSQQAEAVAYCSTTPNSQEQK